MTEKGMDYRYKMKNESYNIFGTVPKSNTGIKTVERDHMDTTNTQIHDRSFSRYCIDYVRGRRTLVVLVIIKV